MSMFHNSNHINPSFLTVVWVFFSLLAVGTVFAQYDAGAVGIFSWIICLGGIGIGILDKFYKY